MSTGIDLAAAIAGLISLTTQIYTFLKDFKSSYKRAASLASGVCTEVNMWRVLLPTVHQIVVHPDLHPSHPLLEVMAQLKNTIRDAVQLYSELQRIIASLNVRSTSLRPAALLWARQETDIEKLVGRLQWHKNTIFGTMSCVKWPPAGVQTPGPYGNPQFNGNEDLLHVTPCKLLSPQDPSQPHEPARGQDSNSIDRPYPTRANIQHDFEQSLEASWVYRRAHGRSESILFADSIRGDSAWAALSDVSSARLSILAVMALPIQIGSIYDTKWYAFNELFGDEKDCAEARCLMPAHAHIFRPTSVGEVLSVSQRARLLQKRFQAYLDTQSKQDVGLVGIAKQLGKLSDNLFLFAHEKHNDESGLHGHKAMRVAMIVALEGAQRLISDIGVFLRNDGMISQLVAAHQHSKTASSVDETHCRDVRGSRGWNAISLASLISVHALAVDIGRSLFGGDKISFSKEESEALEYDRMDHYKTVEGLGALHGSFDAEYNHEVAHWLSGVHDMLRSNVSARNIRKMLL
ncbi:hypothetical protein LTR56_019736 [Elasticomyces elasticus]|nr:hypothetical protein LTR56_019736 [Elasticomyces elasticus]KAK3655804.1 hypothetical protein LTR22_010098 [Elasticomyces elasticus]KAK4925857.1 hypothetical protein LTR49_007234 [Elasticomyces elasticus]KAK5764811.1 hypothetical protein LTS12_005081 [Elasticomyces elasticus]